MSSDKNTLSPEIREQQMLKYKEKGNQFFKQAQYEQALKKYKQAISYHETSFIYSNIARCYLILQDYQKCIESCALSLGLDHDNFKANVMFGDWLIELCNIEQNPDHAMDAQDYYRKAIKSLYALSKEVHTVDINK